jgi:hypothetical protein
VATAIAAEASAPNVERHPTSINWRDVGAIGLLVVMGIAAPMAVAAWLHALDIPRNDDWSYRLVLFRFAESGHYSLQGWGSMTLVGQILWATPFVLVLGSHAWVPGASVAVASTAGIVAAYWLARTLLPRRWATACVMSVLAFPGFLLNTSSFMTDVPAFSAAIACLALGVASSRRAGRRRWGPLAGSLVVGCFGFSIREFDLAAPAAVLVVLAIRDRRHLRLYMACATAVIAVCSAIFAWTTQLPGAQAVLGAGKGLAQGLGAVGAAGPLAPPPPPLWKTIGSSLQSFVEWYFTLAFALSPLLALLTRPLWGHAKKAPPVATLHRSWHALVPGVVLILGVVLMVVHGSVFVGNYLDRRGATGNEDLPGMRPNLLPELLWLALCAIALGAAAVLAVIVLSASQDLRSLKHRLAWEDPAWATLAVFTALSAVGLAFYGVFLKGEMFDRYLWPLVFGSFVLLSRRHLSLGRVRPSPFLSRTLALVLAAVAALVACLITLNSDAFDGARWMAGQKLAGEAISATRIDAGFEWVGYHYPGLAVHGRNLLREPEYDKQYEATFPGFSACALVSSSRLSSPSLGLLGVFGYNELGFAVRERLYLYQVRSPSCLNK